jgi:hypothetical protein
MLWICLPRTRRPASSGELEAAAARGRYGGSVLVRRATASRGITFTDRINTGILPNRRECSWALVRKFWTARTIRESAAPSGGLFVLQVATALHGATGALGGITGYSNEET